MINGIPIQLLVKTVIGKDEFNAPIYSEKWVDVENVLVGEPSSNEVVDSTNQFGKYLSFWLAIPKGDTHDWKSTKVRFFGETFQTFGPVVQGIESLIPGPWHKKVRCERYE